MLWEYFSFFMFDSIWLRAEMVESMKWTRRLRVWEKWRIYERCILTERKTKSSVIVCVASNEYLMVSWLLGNYRNIQDVEVRLVVVIMVS